MSRPFEVDPHIIFILLHLIFTLQRGKFRVAINYYIPYVLTQQLSYNLDKYFVKTVFKLNGSILSL